MKHLADFARPATNPRLLRRLSLRSPQQSTSQQSAEVSLPNSLTTKQDVPPPLPKLRLQLRFQRQNWKRRRRLPWMHTRTRRRRRWLDSRRKRRQAPGGGVVVIARRCPCWRRKPSPSRPRAAASSNAGGESQTNTRQLATETARRSVRPFLKNGKSKHYQNIPHYLPSLTRPSVPEPSSRSTAKPAMTEPALSVEDWRESFTTRRGRQLLFSIGDERRAEFEGGKERPREEAAAET